MNKQKLAGILSGKFVTVICLIFAGLFGAVSLSVLGGNTVNAQEFDDYIFNMRGGSLVIERRDEGQGFSGPATIYQYVTDSAHSFMEQGAAGGPDQIHVSRTQLSSTDSQNSINARYAFSDGRASATIIVYNASAAQSYFQSNPPPGNAGTTDQDGIDPDAEDEEELFTGLQCAVHGGLGYLICPMSQAAAWVVDGALYFLHQILYVNPLSLSFNTGNNPMYAIWSVMRNFANILFAIAFLIIIFSQATSIGISNYGIKRMLPRIIVAVVLVNMSYFLAAFAIEVSNLFGRGVGNFMEAIVSTAGDVGSEGAPFLSFEVVVMGLLFVGAAGAAIWAFAPEIGIQVILAALLPVLIMSLFAVLVAVVTLVARQAIIIMLVIVAPLAFVANLLPNTEGLYKKWQKLFMTMLIFYPLVVFVFAGAQLAAHLLRASSDGSALLQVFSLGVQVVPLFMLPFLFKTAGGVLGKVHGMVNQPDKLGVGKLRKEAEQMRDDQRLKARGRNFTKPTPDFENKRFGKTRKAAYGAYGVFSPSKRAKKAHEAERKRQTMQKALEEEQNVYIADKAVSDPEFAKHLTGGIGGDKAAEKVRAAGVAVMRKQQSEALENEKSEMQLRAEQAGMGLKQYVQAAVDTKVQGGASFTDARGQEVAVNDTMFEAALDITAGMKDINRIEEARKSENLMGNQDIVDRVVARNDGLLRGSGGYHLADNFRDLARRQGESEADFDSRMLAARVGTLSNTSATNMPDVKYGWLANTSGRVNSKFITDGLASGALDDKDVQKAYNNITDALTIPEVKAKIGDRAPELEVLQKQLERAGYSYKHFGTQAPAPGGSTGGTTPPPPPPGTSGGPSPGGNQSGGGPNPNPGGVLNVPHNTPPPPGSQGGGPTPPTPPPATPPPGGQGGRPTPPPPPPTGSQGSGGQGNQGGGTNQGNQGGNNPPSGNFLG